MFFDQAADHSGNERGPDPVPHHVADENAGRLSANRKNGEEIAAHVAGREVETEKVQRAVVRCGARRNGRELLRQESKLKLACHLKFLFHLLIFFAQLPGALLDALFQLGIKRNQGGLGPVAGGFGPIDPSADQL